MIIQWQDIALAIVAFLTSKDYMDLLPSVIKAESILKQSLNSQKIFFSNS